MIFEKVKLLVMVQYVIYLPLHWFSMLPVDSLIGSVCYLLTFHWLYTTYLPVADLVWHVQGVLEKMFATKRRITQK